LAFPAIGHDLAALQSPKAVSIVFRKKAKGFGVNLRFHDLRGTHETILLDKGVPVHTVAARCGHDAGGLLRSYAKRTKKSDTNAANVVGTLTRGVL
jgi:integrase